MANQTWEFRNFTAAEGTQGTVNFLNAVNRQGPGEASAVARDAGSVGLFYLNLGGLGSSTQQEWKFRNFTAAEGTQGTVNFLNAVNRQGPGEASAVARDDGSVGLFYLNPGSLGSSTQQEWAFGNFDATHGPQGVVTFLNLSARQGRGEASAVARNNGSVGLFYLVIGSLGSGTQQQWVFRDFTAAEGTQGAVNFLNEPARQGPGEASAVVRDDGSVALFFLEPGTG